MDDEDTYASRGLDSDGSCDVGNQENPMKLQLRFHHRAPCSGCVSYIFNLYLELDVVFFICPSLGIFSNIHIC